MTIAGTRFVAWVLVVLCVIAAGLTVANALYDTPPLMVFGTIALSIVIVIIARRHAKHH